MCVPALLSKQVFRFVTCFRFIGLAAPVTRSDVSIHVMSMSTESQSVAEVGDRMSRLCLYPDQLRILHTESPCVFLHAPPGCGKTVMLCLKAINWLKAGHNVHIIIVCHEGHAVSRLIEEQTKQALGTETPGCGTVTRLTFDLGWDPQGVQRRRVIRKLRDAQSHNRLHLIMDEVNIGSVNVLVVVCLCSVSGYSSPWHHAHLSLFNITSRHGRLLPVIFVFSAQSTWHDLCITHNFCKRTV